MTVYQCNGCNHVWDAGDEPPREPRCDHRNLPPEFWAARPVLTQIRQAAHNRLVSADSVLLAVLARVVMLTPPTVTLPAIVGSRVSLNLFTSIVDSSGGGKSAAIAVARELLPHQRKDIADPILPSSGEGLIEAFMGTVDEGDGKKGKRAQVMTAGLAWVDEGQGLLAQGERSGSTIMETIRSAWMGGDLGQHNATEERKRWLKAHKYRLCLIIGFQMSYAASLIADGEGGTPQRFTFASANDPAIESDVEWPGDLDWRPPPTMPMVTDIGFDGLLASEIRHRRLLRSRGEMVVDPLDTHADLRKMKLAAALAILDERLDVEPCDWHLAELIDRTSCAVRSSAIEYDQAARSIARRAATSIAVEREEAIESASLSRALSRITRNVARKVWRDGPMTAAQAYRVVPSRDRPKADVDDIVALAIERNWLVEVDGELSRGAAQP